MHKSSFDKAKLVVDHYLSDYLDTPLTILDFGSQVVDDQGLSYREIFMRNKWSYSGVDITPGVNVDIVVSKPYDWSEISSNYADVVISGQAFEHIPFFWVTAYEIARILKQEGIAIVIAPSSGGVHRYPVDCWRFYEDGLSAIGHYAGLTVLDVFTDHGNGDWADSIVILRKPKRTPEEEIDFADRHRMQMLLANQNFKQGLQNTDSFPISAIKELNPRKVSIEFETNRKRMVGGIWPKKERIRRSIAMLLGSDFIQKLVAVKQKVFKH